MPRLKTIFCPSLLSLDRPSISMRIHSKQTVRKYVFSPCFSHSFRFKQPHLLNCRRFLCISFPAPFPCDCTGIRLTEWLITSKTCVVRTRAVKYGSQDRVEDKIIVKKWLKITPGRPCVRGKVRLCFVYFHTRVTHISHANLVVGSSSEIDHHDDFEVV